MGVCLAGLFIWQCHNRELVPATNTLLAISFENANVLTTTPDETTNTWTLTVPYLTNLKILKPTITLTPGASVVPRSGEIQDFTKIVLYTITDSNGQKRVYQIRVQPEGQPVPQLTGRSADSLEAGQTLRLMGHSFGSFGPDVRVIATGPDNLTTALVSSLLDSTQVQIDLPISLTPGRYRLSLTVRNLPSSTSEWVEVQYPAPQFTQLTQHNLRAGDTLQVAGLYVKPEAYRYAVLVSKGGQQQLLEAVKPIVNGFSVRLGADLPAGRYRVQLLNRSTNKISRDTTLALQVYERAKPFLTGIEAAKPTYKPGESVRLIATQFEALPTRFYQLQLTGGVRSYTVNGIYEASSQRLILTLPTTATKGTYSLGVRLLDTTGQLLYSFDTDQSITIL
ncbi:hypothetical protein Slin_4310 [Spirosoma linguale DSM 74]|uniref:DUF5018 domain-containing protein n=2 Tax=Spirosoma TaxID=107 RepID=D2QLK2_SPILD|nr:hypothetical protein Slin_4310 [Spirosoma linguale DSM 74]